MYLDNENIDLSVAEVQDDEEYLEVTTHHERTSTGTLIIIDTFLYWII
jgi:hypothetical protein